MKKIIIIACALSVLLSASLKAQFSKGNIMLGITSSTALPDLNAGTSGSLLFAGISTVKYPNDEKEKYKYFNLSPTAGYFVIDNLVAGLSINLAAIKFNESYLLSETIWSLGPYVRYYYQFEKVSPFAELNVGIGGVKTVYGSSGGDETEEKAKLFNLGGGAGAAIPIGGVVTIDIMGGYFISNMKQEASFGYSSLAQEGDWVKIKQGTLGFKVGIHVFLSPFD